MNLPNAITDVPHRRDAGRSPWLIVMPSGRRASRRGCSIVAAAITDYFDGKLARVRNLVTDLGRLLDPLADKLLLVARSCRCTG